MAISVIKKTLLEFVMWYACFLTIGNLLLLSQYWPLFAAMYFIILKDLYTGVCDGGLGIMSSQQDPPYEYFLVIFLLSLILHCILFRPVFVACR